MGIRKIMSYPTEHGFMYTYKNILDRLDKKAIITSQYVKDNVLHIEHIGKRDNVKGIMELHDIGENASKIKDIKEKKA